MNNIEVGTSATEIQTFLRRFQPLLVQMPYCTALSQGRFSRSETLAAEVVELYRAFNTRDQIKKVYLGKLRDAVAVGTITGDELRIITQVVEDEGETEEHVDHLDMRLQLFSSAGISRATVLAPNPTLDLINQEWLGVMEDADALTAIAVFGAIEDWYSGIAGIHASAYLALGYSSFEVETYSEHHEIEPTHSSLQIGVLAAHASLVDPVAVAVALTRVFRTSVGYDYMKLHFASCRDLAELVLES